MPNLEATHIPVWITNCEILSVQSGDSVATDHHSNCIIRPVSGKGKVLYNRKEYILNEDSVLMLGRDTSINLIPDGRADGDYLILRYSNVFCSPQVDLNHICAASTLIDSFFGKKTRFCLIHDQNHIYITLSEIQRELSGNAEEKEGMLNMLFQILLIKLARSFHGSVHPDGPQYVQCARRYIQEHYGNSLSLDGIAAFVGVSRSYLTQLFREHMNRSVVDYIQAVRCDHAAYFLGSTSLPIVEIAVESGFNSRQHFARTFAKIYGLTPMEYRREHFIESRSSKKYGFSAAE